MEATETFQAGTEQFTVAVEIDSGGSTPLIGDVGGTFGDAHIVGNLSLTADLIIEAGVLTGIDTFTLTGNGFQLLVQNGGRLDLAGIEKSAWVQWGEPVVGWQIGDRLAVAPTGFGKYDSAETTWQGSWAATSRPTNSPAVSLLDGRVMQPEVTNLAQTLVLQNLRRVHFHDGAGVQTLKWLKVLNSGQTAILAQYPIHFHQIYDLSRGSVLEGVVVEGGKNHAFVPHGSHGITMRDCVAYKTVGEAFWYDEAEHYVQTPGVPCPNCEPGPLGAFCNKCRSYNNTAGSQHSVANNPHDTTYDRCLVMGLNSTDPFNPSPLTGFLLGAGHGNKCINSVATAIQKGIGPSGFMWPSSANRNDDGNEWEMRGCIAHNLGYKTQTQHKAIFVWQNTPDNHLIKDFTAYRIGGAGIDHGAYGNHYHYQGVVIDGVTGAALSIHPISTSGQPMVFEDFNTNGVLRLAGHQIAGDGITPAYVRRATFTGVVVDEMEVENGQPRPSFPSNLIFEDCPLETADFTFITVNPSSVFELWEGGVLLHRWNNGVWV